MFIDEINKHTQGRTQKENAIQGLTTESNGPCLNLSWNENAIGFGFSPGPLMNPLIWYHGKS